MHDLDTGSYATVLSPRASGRSGCDDVFFVEGGTPFSASTAGQLVDAVVRDASQRALHSVYLAARLLATPPAQLLPPKLKLGALQRMGQQMRARSRVQARLTTSIVSDADD